MAPQGHVSTSIQFGRPLCLPEFFDSPSLEEIQVAGMTKKPEKGKTFRNFYESRRCLLADLGRTDFSDAVNVALSNLIDRMQSIFQFDYSPAEPEFNFIRYTNTEFFDWHIDMSPDGALRRKLSFSIQLTDGTEYEGGDLEFFPETNLGSARKAGSVIVFPPFVPHRVTPITRGTRFALVGWLYGPAFR